MFSSKIRWFDTVDSTMHLARSMGHQLSHMDCIVARQQTAGYGRRGRNWISTEGDLMVSFILKDGPLLQSSWRWVFVASVALQQTMAGYLASQTLVKHKWPNDILLDGKKAAGMLLEQVCDSHNQPLWLVLGVGVNLVSQPLLIERETASLKDYGCLVSVHAFLDYFCSLLSQWEKESWEKVRETWMSHCFHLHRQVQFHLPNGLQFEGIFQGIDDQGFCLLKTDSKIHRFFSGELWDNKLNMM